MSYPRARWRLLITPSAPGPWNMAADEAILESVSHGEVLPTLRLYAWDPPCLSLGYAQPSADVDMERLVARGWQLVRRPTGGRAILHTDELTYAVIGPHNEPRLTGGVLESYHRLAQALLASLYQLGVSAQPHLKHLAANLDEPKQQGPVCFDVPSNYEITFDGKKLIGSAQARRKDGVLQHGTLPLYGDLTRILQVLRFPDEASRNTAAERLLARATTLEEILGQKLAWRTVAQAFIAAFQETLNLELASVGLTPTEQIRIPELIDEKYSRQSWTLRV